MIDETHKSSSLLEARPICRILAQHSGEIVGWLYRWETGELMPLWLKEAMADCFVEIEETQEIRSALGKYPGSPSA